MDPGEWVLLSGDEYHDLDHQKTQKEPNTIDQNPHRRVIFNKDYFICPPPNPQKAPENKAKESIEVIKEIAKFPIDITILPSPAITFLDFRSSEADRDIASQVFFKKTKENELVDMKIDSPRPTSPRRNIDFRIEGVSEKITSPGRKLDEGCFENKKPNEKDSDEDCDESNGGLNIWKWSLNGFGAIFSFGIAAASFCVIVLRSSRSIREQEQKQKLMFKIYTDDKVF